MFRLASMSKALNLTLRASTQTIDTGNINTGAMPSRIVVKGKNKAITGGKLKQGEGTGSSIKVEITYIMIEVNKVKKFELDKLNFVYKVNGVDLLAAIRKQV
jgi:P2 family phage contractile tail tube protein